MKADIFDNLNYHATKEEIKSAQKATKEAVFKMISEKSESTTSIIK